jgi:hypothetical protein
MQVEKKTQSAEEKSAAKDYVIHVVNRGRGTPLLESGRRGQTPTTLGEDIIIHLENNGYLVEIEEEN